MNPPFRIEPEAATELEIAAYWYDGKHPGLGVEFLEAVDAVLMHIRRWPQAGSPVVNVSADLPVRRAPTERFPYHVVYVETPAAIRILAVAHDGREPGYWQRRTKK